MSPTDRNQLTSPEQHTTSSALQRLSLFLLVGAFLFFGYAIWQRNQEVVRPARSPNYPPAGVLPEGFHADQSPEANAFRITCNRCHNWPSPRLHDPAGWLGVKRLMRAQIAERRMEIPQQQIDLAIEYAIRHARPARKPLRPKLPVENSK